MFPALLERAPQGRVRRLGEGEVAERGAQVQAGASLDDDGPPLCAQPVDDLVRLPRVLRHRELVLRRHEADEVARRELAGLGLIGDDREPAVDLHGVGHDDRGAEARGEHGGDGGLAERRRPEQGQDRRRWRRTRVVCSPGHASSARGGSPSRYRVTVKRSTSNGSVGPIPAFCKAMRDLLSGVVDAVEIREQHAPADAAPHDDPVDPGVQVVERARLAGAEHVDRAGQLRQLVRTHAEEAGVSQRGRVRVAHDLAPEGLLGGLERADAAAQVAVLLERDEAGRRPPVQRVVRRLRCGAPGDVRRHAGPGEVGRAFDGPVAHVAASAGAAALPKWATR